MIKMNTNDDTKMEKIIIPSFESANDVSASKSTDF